MKSMACEERSRTALRVYSTRTKRKRDCSGDRYGKKSKLKSCFRTMSLDFARVGFLLFFFFIVDASVTPTPLSVYNSSASTTTSASTVLVPVPPTTLGHCQCDQTTSNNVFSSNLDSCDINCCCDTDCSLSVVTTIFNLGVCRPQGPDPPRIEYCSEAGIATVNLPKSSSFVSIKKQATQDGVLKSQLCIVHDNNPKYGNYFSDPGPGTSAELALGKLSSTYYHWFNDKNVQEIGTISILQSFKANESIPFGFNRTLYDASTTPATITITTTIVQPEGGVMKVPASIYSNACDDINVLGYLFDIPFDNKQQINNAFGRSSQCEQVFTNLEIQCTSEKNFNIDSFVDTRYVGRDNTNNNFVSIKLKSLRVKDVSTGSIILSTTSDPNQSLNTTGLSPLMTRSADGSISCRNVVVAVHYDVYASGASGGTVTNVDAHITLAENILSASSTTRGGVLTDYTVSWRDFTTNPAEGLAGSIG